MNGRVYPDFQPKPEDVFHAVGYTNQDILSNAHFQLLSLSSRAMDANRQLWEQLGPLVPSMEAGKVKREFVQVFFVDAFLSDDDLPYQAPNGQHFLSVYYLNDSAFRLCREFGIAHPPVISTVKRADIPPNHGISLQTIYYSRK